MRRFTSVVALVAGLLTACAGGRPAPLKVGLMYPTSGPQGAQGLDEQHGAMLAVEWANHHGGVKGHHLTLVTADLGRPEDVPDAMAALAARGVQVVVGTHGSTYSAIAAAEATRRHMLVWETGAIGQMVSAPGGWDAPPVAGGTDFIRMAPAGGDVGKAAVDFVRNGLAPHLPVAGPLRWAVAYVNDDYGSAVAAGAIAEVHATHQPLAGAFPYAETGADFNALVARIAAAHPQALYVAAYLADGITLRRALVAARVPLLVNLGTSSSYCMPEFGQTLGTDAVGVFASDKPDAAAVRRGALTPEGRATLAWASARYQALYHEPMGSHALSGFSNAYALFVHVLPKAGVATTNAVASAAQAVKLPVGTLANGGGLDIAPPGSPDAGNNVNAASVIWEWVTPGKAMVVWPPPFATNPVVWMPIDQ